MEGGAKVWRVLESGQLERGGERGVKIVSRNEISPPSFSLYLYLAFFARLIYLDSTESFISRGEGPRLRPSKLFRSFRRAVSSRYDD